jgi:folylpolyglutamate synthase
MQDAQAITSLTLQKSFAEKWRELDPSPSTTIEVLTSVEDALEYVRALDKTSGVEGKEIKPGKQFQVLITGSLHLVGRAIGVLDGIDAAVY